MKNFMTQKAHLVWMALLTVFVVLPGCGGGEAGGGKWNSPSSGTVVADTVAPTVTSTVPLPAVSGVATNSKVSATFSEGMDSASISAATFTVQPSGPPLGVKVTGTIAYDAATNVATFTPPAGNLAPLTQYTATITTGALDVAGNALASNHVWSFTTGAGADSAAPTVTATLPLNAATGVLITTKTISATFSEAMDQATMNLTNITVQASGPPLGVKLTGTIAYDALTKTVTFAPQSNLIADTEYTVTVTNGAKDMAGNALVVPAAGTPNNPWTFRTAAATPPVSALAINLGSAASFGIASRAGLTSTGVTKVNGDIALDPNATCTDSTGGPGGTSQTCLTKSYASLSGTGMTVVGSIYFAADPFDSGVTAHKVSTDLMTAWIEGNAKANTQPAIAAGELGGKTFIPGVYENANLTLSAGGVATLDGNNDPNAVFIFKTTLGGDFVDSGTLLLKSEIKLINQAQAKNVWFVIGRDATIGSGTTWNGNILAHRTATILNGSTVNGRVLAGAGGAGAITLTGAAAPSVTTINVP